MSAAVIKGLQAPANVLVTGASSGVGLAVTARLLASGGVGRLFAVARTAGRSEALQRLAVDASDRLVCVDADLADEGDVARLARQVGDQVPALHLVFNSAGVLHDDGIRPEKSVTQVRMDALQRVFALNAFAPVLLAGALLPLLRHRDPAVFASLSARVGSIGDNRLGGWYTYRASKAAQNQLLRTFAVELRRLNRRAACLLLHPGTVDTPLSEPFQARVPAGRLFSPERAARQLLDIIARCDATDNGRFIAWDGSPIEW